MAKILQVFPSATVVDAFAGPGRYIDGPSGSSIVIARTYLDHAATNRFNTLRLVCNEARSDRHSALRQRLEELQTRATLDISLPQPADFARAHETIEAIAHPGGAPLPTLWVLDPFDVKSLPFELVARCLASPRDEVLITWFADEIYRFCEVPQFQEALTEHYGSEEWRVALETAGEHGRKDALMAAYRRRLESLPDVRTGALSISSKNASARYSIILATHSDKGLECWNPVRWGLDPSAGRTVSEKWGHQEALFDDRATLREALRRRAGSAASFEELRVEAVRLGFRESQLRTTLDELSAEGIALREHPLDAEVRSPWPQHSVIRFYEGAGPETSP